MTLHLPFGPFRDPHARVRADLSAYFDDELAAGARSRVDQHLATCAACQAELAALRETVALLRAMPVVSPPRSFTIDPASAAALRRHPLHSAFFYGLRNATGAAAALLIAAFLWNAGSVPTPATQPRAVAPVAPASAPSSASAEVRSGQAALPTRASAQPPAAAPAVAAAPRAPQPAGPVPPSANATVQAKPAEVPPAVAAAPRPPQPPGPAPANATAQAKPAELAAPAAAALRAPQPAGVAPGAADQALKTKPAEGLPAAPNPIAPLALATPAPPEAGVDGTERAARDLPIPPKEPSPFPVRPPDYLTGVLGALFGVLAAAWAVIWLRERP